MDITVYKLFHILGILLVFQGLGAAVVLAGADRNAPWRKASMIGHGIGVFVILLGGFGMMARLGITNGFPVWIWIKLAVWVLIGAAPFLLKKKPELSRWVWGGVIGLGVLAASMAIFKPFA